MENTIKELARFFGEPEDEVREKIKNYHPKQLAEEWFKAPHGTGEEVEEFYQSAESYLYELVAWNHTDAFLERIAPLMHYRNKKILEVGAGNGSLCISLALNGNQVTYCDINERLFAFAKQRFADRLLTIKMVKSLRGLRDYDIVVAIDTLEHIHPDILPKLLKDMAKSLKDGGFIYHRSNFGQQDLFPMHYDHKSVLEGLVTDVGLTPRPNGDLVKGQQTQGVQISVPIRGNEHKASLTRDIMALDVPPHSRFVTCEGYPVDLARNKLVEQLNRDWVLFMDSDQTFHPDTVKRLMSWNQDIVSGVTFKRLGEPIPMVYKYMYEENKGHYYVPMIREIGEYLTKFQDELKGRPQNIVGSSYGLLECDSVSTGCLLIHRRVFDALEKPYFKCDEGTKGGEDFYFCRKAQEAGFKIFADPSVMSGHYTEYIRGFKHFMIWSNKEPFDWLENENPKATRVSI